MPARTMFRLAVELCRTGQRPGDGFELFAERMVEHIQAQNEDHQAE